LIKLPDNIVDFLHKQPFFIVSTIDKKGMPHSACKGLVEIDEKGVIYLIDLYKARTYANLQHNSNISLTAVDEHKFIGYSLKGKGKIVLEKDLTHDIIAAWEKKITNRITKRVLKNIGGEKGHHTHPEILLPKPEYMIAIEVDEVIDLTPHHLK